MLSSKKNKTNVKIIPKIDHKDITKKLQKEIELYKIILENLTKEKVVNPLECQICMQDLRTSNLGFITNCNHYYCKLCIKQYIITSINDKLMEIKCPHPKCDILLSQITIATFIDETTLMKYYEYLLDLCVLQSKDMLYCTKKDCSKICVKNDCSNKVNCLYCFNQFCFVCRTTYKTNHRCSHKDIMKDIPEEILQSFDSKQKIKICPQCRNIIEKTDGCNTMKCKICKTQFCWKCLTMHDDIKQGIEAHNCRDYYAHYDGSGEEGDEEAEEMETEESEVVSEEFSDEEEYSDE